MTKIAIYNEQKQRTATVVENLTKAMGRDRKDNDKHTLRLEYSGNHSDSWGSAQCSLHASYGYYGNSSGYRAMNRDVAPYLVKAINSLIVQAADLAMELAKADLEKARLAAESEAKEILGDLAPSTAA